MTWSSSSLRPALGLAAGVAATALLAGCTGSSPTAAGTPTPAATGTPSAATAQLAAQTVAKLGAVPIPTAPTDPPPVVATEKTLQLVAMGEPVIAELPGGVATVTALGPTEDLPSPGLAVPDHVRGTISLQIVQQQGELVVGAGDLSSRDELGHAIKLTAVGPSRATAVPGKPATLAVSGVFQSGAAQITWRHDGRVVTVWDFNIELD